MSRAFVRESDSDRPEALPDRPVSRHPNLVTQTGLAKIEQRLRALDEAHQRALRDGVEAELPALQRELRYWRQRRGSARVIEPEQRPSVARFGVTVQLQGEDGSQRRYQIVGEDEADPVAGLISWVSPVGAALIGHRLGDWIELPDQRAQIIALSAGSLP